MADETKDVWLEQAYKAWEYSSAEFDKNILYISSSALGISFAFIEKIVCLECAHHKDLLLWSWILFAVTILLSLVGSYLSLQFNQKAIENYNPKNPERAYEVKEHRFNIILNLSNVLSIITLISGIVFTLLFVHLNL